MTDKIKIIEKEGTKILFTNLSNLSTKEILLMFPIMTEQAIKHKISLNIIDISNTHSNSEIKDGSKAAIAAIEQKIGKVETALIGIRGIQKIIANAISTNTYFANDLDDAINHLMKRYHKTA
jgi:iron-sulfur cluster repair protein YtfE (RIC family)